MKKFALTLFLAVSVGATGQIVDELSLAQSPYHAKRLEERFRFPSPNLVNRNPAPGAAGTCAGIVAGMNVNNGSVLNGFRLGLGTSWRQPVASLPVDPLSATWLNTVSTDPGSGAPMYQRMRIAHSVATARSWNSAWEGFPVHVVTGSQPRHDVIVGSGDPGPLPIPIDPAIQTFRGSTAGLNADGDKHLLVIDRDNCVAYELFNTRIMAGGKIQVGVASVFDLLASDHQRPFQAVSANVAGVPFFGGIMWYEEAASGTIDHALPVTLMMGNGSNATTWDATSGQWNSPAASGAMLKPPFGARMRLKADFDIDAYAASTTATSESDKNIIRAILRAAREYGLLYMDGGTPTGTHGVSDLRWPYWVVWNLTNNGPNFREHFEFVEVPRPFYADQFWVNGTPTSFQPSTCKTSCTAACTICPPPGSAATPGAGKPVIKSFTADATGVAPGTPVKLSWAVENVPSRLRFVTPEVGPITSESVIVRPAQTTTYTLMVQNGDVGSKTTRQVTVTVN